MKGKGGIEDKEPPPGIEPGTSSLLEFSADGALPLALFSRRKGHTKEALYLTELRRHPLFLPFFL